MKIKNVTLAQLTLALAAVNTRFKGNIRWNTDGDGSPPKALNPKRTRFDVRLRTSSYDAPGFRRTFGGRRHPSACWHVHGHFFDALLHIEPRAVIRSGYNPETCRPIVIDHKGGNWTDTNIGSAYAPLMFSDACDCQNGRDASETIPDRRIENYHRETVAFLKDPFTYTTK